MSGKQASAWQHCTAASRLASFCEFTPLGLRPAKILVTTTSVNCFCNNQDLCLQVATAADDNVHKPRQVTCPVADLCLVPDWRMQLRLTTSGEYIHPVWKQTGASTSEPV